jgi:DNA-binding transcriptional regulator LsrR (DeoR family)
MIARYEAGASMQQIADQLGVHRTTILKRLQGLGITTKFSKLEPDDVRAAAKLYQEGWTLDNIARQYHVASSTVRESLLAYGVEMRPRGRRKLRLA